MFRTLLVLLSLALVLGAPACDNVGRAFDPTLEPNEPAPTEGDSPITVVPVGGDVRDGRPKVRAIFPTGGGWPTTVPIVVEFSESLNEASMLPTSATATDGRVIVRVKNTTQALPCQYDFLANGRVLVLRPTPTLSNTQDPTYEVVLLPDGRDADGVRFQVDEAGEVLAEFQVNQDASFTDGRILTTFPRNNQRDAQRETEYYVVFDRPANAASIRDTNFVLRTGGVPVLGNREPAVQLAGVPDPRVVRFTPAAPLLASARYEFVVDDTITFGEDGTLDFRGRSPFAVFDTVGPAAVVAVALANPTAGFDNKVNRNNVDTVRLSVTTPADAEAGDRIVARIYGGDTATENSNDLVFVERTATLPAAGQQTVEVDFAGTLGGLSRPKFDDGPITFAVQLRRGSQQAGFAHQGGGAPRFDVTPPSLVRAGPPGPGAGTDIFTDQEYLAFFGTANEELATATLADGVNTAVELFASAGSGRFLMRPLLLGRLTAPRAYSLLLTDTAGNLGAAAVTGNIVQRGLVTGAVAGTLTVEAYDHATLLPIADATVLVDPGVPAMPAVGQLVGTTGSDGRAVFTGLAGNLHTVTVVRAGYDLVTLYETGSAFVSLPLRPLADATATLTGAVVFDQVPGATVLVGSSAFDDGLQLAAATTNTSPNTIPPTPIVPNRPQVLSAFGGTIEPTALPTFSLVGYQMLGPTLLAPTPPGAPAAGGGTAQAALTIIPSTPFLTSLTAPFTEDFGLATGLDTSNLLDGGKPLVRATMSLQGFTGQVLNGIGFATLGSGANYSMNASFGSVPALGFGAFGPLNWIVTQARDAAGRVSRHRGAPFTSFLGTLVVDLTDPPAIPTVTVPAGPFTGSPSVTFEDRLDPATAGGGIPVVEVSAQDPAGRRWTVWFLDGDAAGGQDTVQFPDLATNSVAGPQLGAWSVRAEGRFFLTLTAATRNDFVLTERLRQELTFARSAAVTFTVQ